MKIHPNIAQAIAGTLHSIFVEGKQADRAVKALLQSNRKWGSRDRRFMAETIYELVRQWRWYGALAGNETGTGPEDIQAKVAVYFTERGWALPPGYTAPNAEAVQAAQTAYEHQPAIRQSIPDALYEIGLKELGEQWHTELMALNQPTLPILRVNTLKSNKTEILNALAAEGIAAEAAEGYPDAIIIRQRKELTSNEWYKSGKIEIQDASSQLAAPFLQVQPGHTVIDACAGAGGKSLHLAALMQNKGRIMAMDIEERKLEELNKRAHRAGVSIINTHMATAEAIAKHHQSCDRLLLDVPCSGMGVLRRKPHTKWTLTGDFLNEIRLLQADLLNRYSGMLKPGGLMVYATCSIFPSENTRQIEGFLKRQAGTFELEEEKAIFPSQGFDGFYLARLKKIK